MTLKLVSDSHKYTDVKCADILGPGGAHHNYTIMKKLAEGETEQKVLLEINFQNGPILENCINGVMDEDLMEICIDRLEGFQAGKYACQPNEAALDLLKAALVALQTRTKGREERGVEGKSQV